MRFSVRAPASSANLGPGFDALGLALDLWNTVTIDTDGTPGEVINTGTEASLLDGHENLTITAMEEFARHHGRALPSFAITAETNIPVARGLGSSAAALVSGLIAANELLAIGASTEDLFQYAWRMEGHGDNVGAVIYGGAILAVPNIRPAILLSDGRDLGLTAVVFIPEITGATWAARAALPGTLPYADAVANIAHVAGLVIGLKTGDHALIGEGMTDLMHEPYRARLFPHLDTMKHAAASAGAIGTALSGAGPTVLALVPDAAIDTVAAAMTDAITTPGVVSALSIVSTGASLTAG